MHRIAASVLAFLCGLTGAASAHPAGFRVLYNFRGGSDGSTPQADLIAAGGKLYGVTTYGGGGNAGTLFSLDIGTGAETVLYSFGKGTDAAYPQGRLLKAGHKLYGTTVSGGAAQWGTLFSFDLASGAEQVLYAFQGGADGGNPMGGLIERGGMLYGTAMSGGSQACSFGCGVIYALDRGTGAMKAVYSFQSGNDGAFPNAGLAEAGGLLFGTTLSGGAGDAGTVFSVNPATGAERKRHDFDRQGDGTNPVSALTNVGGTLYGATVEGGSANQGVIFAIDRRTGAERVVQSFVRTNGTGPEGGVVEAGGKLYGTASEGGSGNDGVVFEAGPRQGAGKILHSFAGSDGAAPWAGLVQVGDTFYGTASGGGAAGAGDIFAVTP